MEQKLCRTCLSGTDNSIFKTVFLDQNKMSLVDMLKECTGIEVSEVDEISLNICDSCTEEIIRSYVYRKKCWDSHKFLLEKLEVSKMAIEAIDPITVHSEMDADVIELWSDSENEQSDCFLKEFEPTVKEDRYVKVKIKHRSKNSFKCKTCGRIYSNRISMRRHLRIEHNILGDDNQFECKECKKTFGLSTSLRRHMINVHEQPDDFHAAKFVCHYCGQQFKVQQNFTEHVRRHTGEKPFKCDLCDYTSRHSGSVKIHRRIHTGERPFQCNVCGKDFRTSSGRSYHRKSHSEETPFECIVCSKKFKKKEIYKEHMLIHNPDKHIECKFCSKKFARKDNLRTHLKQHTGEKPHVCECCGKGFIQKHCWRNHMVNHHNYDMSTLI